MRTRVQATSKATPEQVYDVLADVAGHRRWAGDDQIAMFALLELTEVPNGAAGVGAGWSSRGRIPMHRQQFDDASRVMVADGPHCFEYVTQSRIARSRSRPSREGTYRHRYEIVPQQGNRSRITYTISEQRSVHPLLRVAVPGVRNFMWATGVRLMARRGVRNIAASAEAAGS